MEAVKRAEADGKTAQIKFGALANNSSGNIIDVGGKEFRFTWAPEPGELCDIYEEQKSGEKGNGVLVESGASWRKLGVQRILNESARDRVKMSSAEAERQQKSRKAIILDHATPVVKNQTKSLAITSNDPNTRKLLLKTKKEPPPKKRKIEESAAAPTSDMVAKPVVSQPNPSSAASIKSATSPVAPESENPTSLPQPTSVQGTSGTHSSKGHGKTDEAVNCQHSNKSDVGKQKDKASTLSFISVTEGGQQKSGACSTATDLRNLLITTLTENPKGMTIKAIEKAIKVSGKNFEPIIKTIATFQAPGKYILKHGVEKESSVKLSPGIGSSRECQPTESPFLESSPVSEKAEPTNDQQMHSTPTQDSDLNIVDEIDEHLQESPNGNAGQKNTINSDGSGSSSSTDSGSESDSDSDSGSSDSGSESGTSSDSESEASSSSSEGSDVHVDITSDDDKLEEEETEQKLKGSKASPSHVGKDGSGESPEQKGMVEEKDAGRILTSPGNSEDVDIGDDAGEGEAISNNSKHNVEKIACDGEDDTDMALDVDVISCEGEAKIAEEKLTTLPSHRKEGDSYSPFGGSVWEPEDNRSEGKENQIEESLQKYKEPKSVSKHVYDRNQTQTVYDKYMPKQENRSRTKKKEGVRTDIRRKRDVISSQSCYESPAIPEHSPNRKDFETRKFSKEINKPRFKDTMIETAIEHGNPLGRSSGQSIAEIRIDNRKDVDHERFDQLNDGHQSYSRSSLADSRAKTTDALYRSADFKISKSHDRTSRIINESDVSAVKSSNLDEKNPRHDICFGAALEDDTVFKGKLSDLSKNFKDTDQNAWQLGDAGFSGQLFMRDAAKHNSSYDFDTDQLPSGKESVLRREYSELELGEFREPVYEEEETQEFKVRFDKSQNNRDVTETKVKNGSTRESASPDVTKGHAIGREVSAFKKLSPSVPNEDFSKHDGRIGKRMLEDGGSDLRKPSKKSRQSPSLDHVDSDPMTNQEKMLDIPVRATTTEMGRTSPYHKMEMQHSAGYRKTSTNNLHKPEYKGRVQEATASESKDNSQRIKGNINSDQKNKENIRMENIVIPKKRKHGSLNEEQSFYAKYEKNKPDLRGCIRNIDQYRDYVAEFNDKYSTYMKLHTALESDKSDFEKLGIELQSAEDRGDTKSYASISAKVKETFGRCGPRHKRMKKVFVVLHEELQILKQRVSDFAERYCPQK